MNLEIKIINPLSLIGWEEKFALNVWYVDHQSLWLDLKIIALTAWKILKCEGISQPGHATMEECKSQVLLHFPTSSRFLGVENYRKILHISYPKTFSMITVSLMKNM